MQSVPASQHAVICMPQVSSIDMGNLLRFIYEGQIKISRRSLRPFLATAKLLRIKGMDFELNEVGTIYKHTYYTLFVLKSLNTPLPQVKFVE